MSPKTPQSGFLEEAEAMPAESPPVVDINCRICSYRILSYYLNCEIDPFSFDQLYYFQRYFIVFFEGENRSRKYLTDSTFQRYLTCLLVLAKPFYTVL